jgi:hypothetical protein
MTHPARSGRSMARSLPMSWRASLLWTAAVTVLLQQQATRARRTVLLRAVTVAVVPGPVHLATGDQVRGLWQYAW